MLLVVDTQQIVLLNKAYFLNENIILVRNIGVFSGKSVLYILTLRPLCYQIENFTHNELCKHGK